MNIQEIQAKSILTKSKLPDTDYVVNPYTGCQFGCLYCYASFMGRFVNESINNWGNYVYVKANAISLFEKELKSWSSKRRQSSILLSSVTDPYHGIEAKYRLTKGILEILARENYPGEVSILTKSPMVLRDLDILLQIPNLTVGITVTTTEDQISRFLEVGAPPASKRIDALRELNSAGINTYAFVGPLLPHFRYKPDLLDDLFGNLAQVGVKSIYVEHINLRQYIKERLWQTLQHESQEVQQVYREAETDLHRQILDDLVNKLLQKHNLNLNLNEVIYHQS